METVQKTYPLFLSTLMKLCGDAAVCDLDLSGFSLADSAIWSTA